MHAVGQSLLIGPIASVGVVAPLVAAHAGAVAPLVVLLAFAGSLCVGWTVGLYARRYAGAGGIYEFVACTHGKLPGILAAGVYFFGSLTASGIIALLAGLLWQDFAQTQLGFDPGWWTGGIAALLLVVAVMYRGVGLSTETQLTLTALSAIPFIVLAVALIADPGAGGNTFAVFDPGNDAGGDVFRALLFGLTLFAGYEAAATLGEEQRLPHRSIPRAILITIAFVGGFYLLVIYAATVGFGPANVARDWGGNPPALPALADQRVGAPLGALLEVAIIIDLLAVLSAFGNNQARGIFALARDRLLPAPLAARSRHDTPVGGIATFVLAALAAFAAAVPLTNRFDQFEAIAVAGALVTTPIIFLLAIGALRLLARQRRQLIASLPLIAAGAAVPALALYGTLDPFPIGAARYGLWIAVAVYAATLAWATYLRVMRPAVIARAAEHALTPP